MLEKEPTFFYLFRTTDGKKIKVGITWSLKVRKSALQRSAKCQLELIGCRLFDTKSDALDMEEKFHFMAGGGPRKGEWYEYQPALVRAFYDLCGSK